MIMHCPNCGSEMPGDSHFCGSGGAKMTSGGNDTLPKKDSEQGEVAQPVSSAQDATDDNVSGGFRGFLATKKGKSILGGGASLRLF